MRSREILDNILSISTDTIHAKSIEEFKDFDYEKEKIRFYSTIEKNIILKTLYKNTKENGVIDKILEGKDVDNFRKKEKATIIYTKFLHDVYFKTLSNPVASFIQPLTVLFTKPSDAVDSTFDYIKSYSVIVAIGYWQLLRFTFLRYYSILWSWVPNLSMVINILEAVIEDLFNGNINNALVGIILIFKIPYFRFYQIDKNNMIIDPYGKKWWYLYISWNLNFIYNNIAPDSQPFIYAKLISDLYTINEINPNLARMSRSYTLSMYIAGSWKKQIFINKENYVIDEMKKYWGKHNLEYAKKYLFGQKW